MPVSGRYGNPAPSSPPVPVPDRALRAVEERIEEGNSQLLASYRMAAEGPPGTRTAATLRDQLQARAEELRAQIASLQAAKDELALIERMLEVK